MTPAPADQAARERAVRDHDGPLAIEAGAGTGKTTLLVARILHGLEEGCFPIQEIAAITFTRKAAAELRGRLRRALAERRRGAKGEAATRLADAARMLPLAQISTIHAFCNALLGEFGLAVGLAPQYHVVEGTHAAELKDRAWEAWIAERLSREEASSLLDALRWGASLEGLAQLAAAIQEQGVLDPVEAPMRRVDAESLWSAVLGALSAFAARVDEACSAPDDALRVGLAEAREALADLGALSAEARAAWLLDHAKGSAVQLPGIRVNLGRKANYPGGELPEIKQDLKSWRDVELPAEIRRALRPVPDAALAALANFARQAQDARAEDGRLLQSDLLSLTLRLLDEHREIRRSIARRYRAILVDEYQDTDPLQAHILRRLSAEDGGPDLFLVGDPKQSIYRFRGADVGAYGRDVEVLRDQRRFERISVNFRSTPALLDVTGRICEEVLAPGQFDEAQAAWQRLDPAPGREDSGQGAALVLAPVGGGESLPRDEAGLREALTIAAELRRAYDEGAAWSEMAVLFPLGRRAHLLEEAFAALDIPYRQEKSQRFYRQVEVAEIATVVSSVADPWDETLAVAALRTRLFGVSDAVLARHRGAGGHFVAARVDPSAGDARGDGAVLDALRKIAGWSGEARIVEPPALIERILDETRYLLLLERLPHGARAAGNVRKLLDQARSFWAEGGQGLDDLAAWLLRRVEHERSREAESASAEDDERVALLTIHAAKGLEWRVVALYGTDHSPHHGSPPLLRRPSDERLELRLRPLVETAHYGEEEARDRELERAERARLLYVALTRASERVVVAYPEAATRLSPLSLLALLRTSETWRSWEQAAAEGRDPAAPRVIVAAEPAAPETARRPAERPAPPEAIREARARRERWQAERAALLERAASRIVVTPSELHGHAPGRVGPGQDPLAREIGSATHLCLEWLVLGSGTGDARLRQRVAELFGIDTIAAGRVEELLAHAAGSSLLERARDAEICLPEHPFAAWLALEDLPPRVANALRAVRGALPGSTRISLEGVVDLVFSTGDGGALAVIDYKTDAWSSDEELDELAEHYAPQIEAYAAALAACTSRPVTEAWLLMLGGPVLVERRVPLD